MPGDLNDKTVKFKKPVFQVRATVLLKAIYQRAGKDPEEEEESCTTFELLLAVRYEQSSNIDIPATQAS